MIIANDKKNIINYGKSFKNVQPRRRKTIEIIRDHILLNLSSNIRNIMMKIPEDLLQPIEEIRLRIGKPFMLHENEVGWFVTSEGNLTNRETEAYIVTHEDVYKTLELMSSSSIYAVQDELKNGFITILGGHRVGIVGRVVITDQKISFIKDISAMNIRISKQIIGAADKVIPQIIKKDKSVYNTLIISPPQCGKTTMLRDIARQLSFGIKKYGFEGIKVGIVDERSEIAGCYKGIAQNDVGPRTDVLDACPKAWGMMMMIRSMSPTVLITDEIGLEEDLEALKQVLNAGVKIVTSIHGYGREDIIKKPILDQIFLQKLFERIIVLGKSKGTGTVEEVFDVWNGEILCC